MCTCEIYFSHTGFYWAHFHEYNENAKNFPGTCCPGPAEGLAAAPQTPSRPPNSQLRDRLLKIVKKPEPLIFPYFDHWKADFHAPKNSLFSYLTESPLKMMKNDFYFMLKAIFVLESFVKSFWLCRETTW